MSDVQKPLSSDQIDDIFGLQSAETAGVFSVTYEHMRFCFDGLVLLIVEQLDVAREDDPCALMASIGKLFVEVAAGTSQMIAQNQSGSHPYCRISFVIST